MEHIFQTLLGFDFGTKSIGVAVGQMVTKTAKPLVAHHTELYRVNEGVGNVFIAYGATERRLRNIF